MYIPLGVSCTLGLNWLQLGTGLYFTAVLSRPDTQSGEGRMKERVIKWFLFSLLRQRHRFSQYEGRT